MFPTLRKWLTKDFIWEPVCESQISKYIEHVPAHLESQTILGGAARRILSLYTEEARMREASFELMELPLHRNGTPMSLQNECEDGTSHHTEEPSGTRVRMKVSTLERSEGVGMLVVERQKDLTIIELERELIRQEICGARGRRAIRAAFDLTMTTMDRRKGPLDVLKGWRWLPGL